MDLTVYEIHSVEMRDAGSDGHHWVLVTKRADGSSHTFSFPHIAWAARAAEYGIDPGDIDTLLDVCLHEGFEGINHTHPDFVYNNPEDHARSALLSRIADTKRRHLVTDPNNLLQAIRAHHGHTPHAEFHQRHRERVRAIRNARVSHSGRAQNLEMRTANG